jgi:mono/diheme cytochrome c family protein
MKKFFKWTGLVLGVSIILLLVAYGFIYFRTKSRFDKNYEVAVQPVKIPADTAMLATGKHIAAIKGCNDCHGKDFGGNIVIDDPGLGLLAAPNITTGKGGLTDRNGSFTDVDYVRAIRHGLNKKGKTLKLMPSYEYHPLSNKDLGALIAYLKSVPAVDREMPAIKLRPLAYVLTNFDKLPLAVAEKIDHTAKNMEEVKPEITAAYGQYVAVSCVGCHGQNYQGGAPVIPGSPQVPNITGAGSLAKWSEEQFIQTLRTGVTPEGKKLDPKYMPWPMAKEFNETEIKSVYLFLKGLPSTTTASL